MYLFNDYRGGRSVVNNRLMMDHRGVMDAVVDGGGVVCGVDLVLGLEGGTGSMVNLSMGLRGGYAMMVSLNIYRKLFY